MLDKKENDQRPRWKWEKRERVNRKLHGNKSDVFVQRWWFIHIQIICLHPVDKPTEDRLLKSTSQSKQTWTIRTSLETRCNDFWNSISSQIPRNINDGKLARSLRRIKWYRSLNTKPTQLLNARHNEMRQTFYPPDAKDREVIDTEFEIKKNRWWW